MYFVSTAKGKGGGDQGTIKVTNTGHKRRNLQVIHKNTLKMHPLMYIAFTAIIFITNAVSLPTKVLNKLDENSTIQKDKLTSRNTTGTAIGRENSALRINSRFLYRTNPNPCKLQVQEDSKDIFTGNISKYHYNFVHLKLDFLNLTVNETGKVINKNEWIWTYKGQNGAHQYLILPGDFGYLSFGLLWSHTLRQPLHININSTGNCNNLTIGEIETDNLIGQALGHMTSNIAATKDYYNSSYWCYTKRYWIYSYFLYNACKNYVCTFQTVDYMCCKYYIDYVNKSRVVQCGKDHYQFGGLWWVLPIIVGNVCWAFYPILLVKIGISVKAMSKNTRKHFVPLHPFDNHLNRSESSISNEKLRIKQKDRYISPKTSNPITFISSICSPLYDCDIRGPVMSRVLRIWIIIFPMTLTALRVLVDNIFARDVVIGAVKNGALVGFSSIIAGPGEARKHFLYIFGGPVAALAINILFGSLLVVFPSNFEDFIVSGLPERVNHYLILLRMPVKMKEKLSGTTVRNHKGYKVIYKLFLAQIFMLLHLKFWRQSFTLFYRRWRDVLFPKLIDELHSGFAAVTVGIVSIPVYSILCALELIVSVLYFAFPVINSFFIVLKSYVIHYDDCFNNWGIIMKIMKYVLFLPMLVLFCISWYMYCIIFFDGFWFLSKIVMFTYSGIIAYPELSYGYLVLVFMTIYYVTESFNAFGENYKELLQISIEASKKFQLKHCEDKDIDTEQCNAIRSKYGIKRDLFYTIVDRNLPRRNQILLTVLKLTSVITILTVSVELLRAFDRFQELSVVTHVFTVLFICSLPKIVRVLFMQNYSYRTRKRMRQKVYRTISDYVRNGTATNSDKDDKSSQMSRRCFYETFQDANVTTEAISLDCLKS